MSTAPQVIWDPEPPPPKKQAAPAPAQTEQAPQVVWDEPAPTEKPGFFGRLSQQVFGTQHPVDEAVSEAEALYHHPLDTLTEATKQAAMIPVNLANRALPLGEAIKQGETGDYSGATKTLAMGTPNLLRDITGGQQFAEDVANRNYGGAAGTLAGDIALATAPQVSKWVGDQLQGGIQAASRRMYQSALKPGPGSYSTPEVNRMVNTGLQEEIPVSEAGAEKLQDLVSDLNDKVQAQIQAGSKAGATVNKYAVTNRLSDAARRFATQVNPESDLAAISESGNEFLRNQPTDIPAADAQALKSGTYQQIKSRAYGEMGTATTEAQKALARGLKEELQQQFPEIGSLNAREARLIGLDEALERAVRRTSNRDIFSLGGKIAAGVGGTLGAAIGGAPGAEFGLPAGMVMHYYMSDPAVQSRLAISLNRAAGLPPGVARAAVASYVGALAEHAGVSGAGPSSDSSQPLGGQ